MKNTLIEYVRVKRGSRNGQLRGVVVAVDKGIGWSYVNLKAGDTFDKVRGLDIALARCDLALVRPLAMAKKKVPHEVAPVLDRMKIRAAKYFKPATV
jgi:hypothetical protein